MSELIGTVPINAMQICERDGEPFFLFLDIFIHAERKKITACAAHYGDDMDWAAAGISLDEVQLEINDKRVVGTCIRHRLDSWEPAMLFDFESEDIATAIQTEDTISFSIIAGEHAQKFELNTHADEAHKIAMSVIIKNENRWIRHYLDYYLTCMEVDHIYVYNNGPANDPVLQNILAPYEANGQISTINWPYRWRNHTDQKQIGQPPHQAHSLNRFPGEWIGFFDVDEFLRIPDKSLPEFLADYPAAAHDGLSFGLRWFMHQGDLSFSEIENPLLSMFHAKRDSLGRKRQKLMVSRKNVRFLRFHWLEEGKQETTIPDHDIFFHHYYLREQRFKEGLEEEAEIDDYMLRFAHKLSPLNDVGEHSAATNPAQWIGRLEECFERAKQDRNREKLDLEIDGIGNHTHSLLANLEAAQHAQDAGHIILADPLAAETKQQQIAQYINAHPGALLTVIEPGEKDGPLTAYVRSLEDAGLVEIAYQRDCTDQTHLGQARWGNGLTATLIKSTGNKQQQGRWTPTVNIMIMSKDRPFQLEALLRSKEKFFKLRDKTAIIYRATDDLAKKGYEKLIDEYPEIEWLEEQVFRDDLLLWVERVPTEEHMMFLVDDIVFTRAVGQSPTIAMLVNDPEVMCISLRLGANVTWCHPRQMTTVPPDLSNDGKWEWRTGHAGYWNYPMSVDGNIYRAADLKPLLPTRPFLHAPQVEASLSGAPLPQKYLVADEEPSLVNLAINRVQDLFKNPAGNVSVESLNQKLLDGEVLDIDAVRLGTYDSCHIEPEVRFTRSQDRKATLTLDLRELSVFVINKPDDTRRRQFMETQLNSLGIQAEFVPAMTAEPGFIGQAISHLKAIRHEQLATPFLVLEDDVLFTEDFETRFSVPAAADAVYLGVSQFGTATSDALSWGKADAAEFQPFSAGFKQIKSMLSRHAILYLTEDFRHACVQASMEALTNQEDCFPGDVGYAQLQSRFLVVAPEAQWCIQNPKLSKNANVTVSPWQKTDKVLRARPISQKKPASPALPKRRKVVDPGKLPKVYIKGITFTPNKPENSIPDPTDFQLTPDIEDADSGVHIYANSALQRQTRFPDEVPGRKIAWITESPAIAGKFGINDFVRDHVEKIANTFDVFLCADRSLAGLHEKFQYHPAVANGSWIRSPRIHPKDKLCSMFVSPKKMVPEHVLRHQVAARYQHQVDLFGGPFGSPKLETKYAGLEPYMFSITMENSKISLYYSEKITDCMATGTVPIYWGSSDISEVYNADGIITLDDQFDLSTLTRDLYDAMMPAIEDNFERFLQLESSFDRCYRLYIEPSELRL